ncbi:hypothetical protein BBOV_II003965 [Babesia bovis T2Bo]|uniref:hypothetical protein n=1 Tax=Babesia bovis T2Bo TaxID=484906 RepID=UPI001C36D400|nr:hypothetical protein BBOV_II003965 [Babesia bovis T2Bo]KAG6440156.1 hypothetical protein BBOV_II003965 [Babesia bovis T2Bo]
MQQDWIIEVKGSKHLRIAQGPFPKAEDQLNHKLWDLSSTFSESWYTYATFNCVEAHPRNYNAVTPVISSGKWFVLM